MGEIKRIPARGEPVQFAAPLGDRAAIKRAGVARAPGHAFVICAVAPALRIDAVGSDICVIDLAAAIRIELFTHFKARAIAILDGAVRQCAVIVAPVKVDADPVRGAVVVDIIDPEI